MTDFYRKQAVIASEFEKLALLDRVMERHQVEVSIPNPEHEYRSSGKNAQQVRVPDWFAD